MTQAEARQFVWLSAFTKRATEIAHDESTDWWGQGPDPTTGAWRVFDMREEMPARVSEEAANYADMTLRFFDLLPGDRVPK